jgi:flagellar biosynthesis/type III secretory pathway protein FliH
LSELAETAIYNTIQKKIIEIAYDLAGYQIDKMPEKYEKKIKSLLKNINCFEDKITIEINDEDHQAISKLEKFSDGLDKSIFIPNKDLSRGDIILNCDGMHYSEKNINN